MACQLPRASRYSVATHSLAMVLVTFSLLKLILTGSCIMFLDHLCFIRCADDHQLANFGLASCFYVHHLADTCLPDGQSRPLSFLFCLLHLEK
jgi:hypothetical protein